MRDVAKRSNSHALMRRLYRAVGVAVCCLCVLLPLPAWAKVFSADEKAELERLLVELDKAAFAGDHAKALSYVPSKLIVAIAQKSGQPPKRVYDQMVEQARSMMSGGALKLLKSRYETENVAYRQGLGAVPYALVALTVEMRVQGQGHVRTRTNNLAFKEDGSWRIITVGAPQQLALVKEVYPEFAGMEFRTMTVEKLGD